MMILQSIHAGWDVSIVQEITDNVSNLGKKSKPTLPTLITTYKFFATCIDSRERERYICMRTF